MLLQPCDAPAQRFEFPTDGRGERRLRTGGHRLPLPALGPQVNVARQRGRDGAANELGIGPRGSQNLSGDSVGLRDQAEQQVLAPNVVVAERDGLGNR